MNFFFSVEWNNLFFILLFMYKPRTSKIELILTA